MNKKKTPAIRFQGFTEDWEQRRLGELVTIERGGSPRPIDAYITDDPDGLNWVKIGDAPEQGSYITHTEEKIKPSGLSKTRQVFPGDLILSNSMSFGKPYIMSIPGCIHDGWLLIRNNQNIFDLKFLCQLLGIKQMLEQYGQLAAGSTVNNLNKELVAHAIVKISSKAEQGKISVFLEAIDNIIALHQRKLTKLHLLKKSMLTKMFPKDGARVPEIRFQGFHGDWKEQRLSKLAEVKDSARIPNSLWASEGVPYIRASDLTNDDLSGTLFLSSDTFSFYKNRTGAPEKGDVLFNGGGEIGKALLKPDDSDIYVQGGAVLYVKTSHAENLSGEYLTMYFQSPFAKDYINIAQAGGTMKHFTLQPAQDMPIVYPSDEEQHKIGVYFQHLDNLYAIHQRKLSKLQQIKQAMLSKLFV